MDIVLAAFLGAVLIILVFKPESKKEGHEKSADGMKKMLDLSARKHGRTAWWACVQYDLLNNGTHPKDTI